MNTCPRTPTKKSRALAPPISSPYFSKPQKEKIVIESHAEDLEDLYRQLELLKPKLIQERVAHDPWKLLVAVTLLNKTTAKVALPVFWDLISKWETAWALSQADESQLQELLYPLGTYNIRSRRLIQLSKSYLLDPPSPFDARPSRPSIPSPSKSVSPDLASPRRKRIRYPATPVSHLPGAGPYALDSYRIFCTTHEDPFSEEWKLVHPTDKELISYLRWKWAFYEHMEWSPDSGSTQLATAAYLTNLVADLTLKRTSDDTNEQDK